MLFIFVLKNRYIIFYMFLDVDYILIYIQVNLQFEYSAIVLKTGFRIVDVELKLYYMCSFSMFWLAIADSIV